MDIKCVSRWWKRTWAGSASLPICLYTLCVGLMVWMFGIYKYTAIYKWVSPTQLPGEMAVASEFRGKYYLTASAREALSLAGREDLMVEGRECQQRLPTALIIGVMKAGTEAFTRHLLMHPQIAMQINLPSTRFFTLNYKHGKQWYIDQMMCSTEEQITIEKAPQYFCTRTVPSRVKELLPGVKIILLVRNPVDRAISNYLQMHYANRYKIEEKTFEEMVFDENEEVRPNSPFIDKSTYIIHLEHWLQYFNRSNILIIDGDKFKTEAFFGEMKKTEKFLGIRHYITADKFVFDASKGFYCPKTNSSFAESNIACLGNGKGRPHPRLQSKHRSILENYFKPYNKEFFKVAGLKFPW